MYILSNLRFIVSQNEESVVREYDGVLAPYFSSKIRAYIVEPMIVDIRTRENAEEIDRRLGSFSWTRPVSNFLKNKRYSFMRTEEVMSEMYSDKERIIHNMINSLQRNMQSLTWRDFSNYWNGLVFNFVSNLSKSLRHDKEDLVGDPRFVILTDEPSYEDEDVVLQEELSRLKSYLISHAKTSERAKLFVFLLEAMVENEFFTALGRKKFIGSLYHLPKKAPRRDDEKFWRNVWDHMRPLVCKFFHETFKARGVSMTRDQERVVCSSDRESLIAQRVFESEVRFAIAGYVLGF